MCLNHIHTSFKRAKKKTNKNKTEHILSSWQQPDKEGLTLDKQPSRKQYLNQAIIIDNLPPQHAMSVKREQTLTHLH